jgi:hypothetical protein
VGRSKEIVNRGGEKISPLAVEDVLLRHAAVREVACFAAPHAQLGEVVGALVVLEAGRQSTHEALRHWCVAGVGDALALDDKWAPALTVFSARVPKGPTGKPLRIKLAQRLGVEALDQLRAATPVSFDVGPDAFLDAATPVSLRSSAPAFFAAAASSSKRDADSSPEAVDDSMALFAKGGGPAGPPKPSAAAMQGHVYFVAMLGILLTHGSLPLDHVASPARPRNWAGMRQLRANIGAGYGIALFFAVAGAGDARNFERHGRRERQTAREVLKPLAIVYGAMVLLDASSHVVYESLRRNFGWGWAEAQKAPWPLRPNLNRTKWFVAMLAFARLLGRKVRALPRESPLRRCVPVVALVVHVGQVALAPLGGVEVPGRAPHRLRGPRPRRAPGDQGRRASVIFLSGYLSRPKHKIKELSGNPPKWIIIMFLLTTERVETAAAARRRGGGFVAAAAGRLGGGSVAATEERFGGPEHCRTISSNRRLAGLSRPC